MKSYKEKLETHVDYKVVCRCCLKSDAEFYKLDSLMVAKSIANNDASERIPLLRCLLFCIRTENVAELPLYICKGCSKSLQVSYYFLQNALRAHEILCRKLCPDRMKTQRMQRLNGQQGSSDEFYPKDGMSKTNEPNQRQQRQWQSVPSPHEVSGGDNNCGTTTTFQRPSMRQICKICGAVLHNKTELKHHIRLHSDVVAHKCKFCNFITLKQRQIQDHYRLAHNLKDAQINSFLKQAETNRKLKLSMSTQSTTNSNPSPSIISTAIHRPSPKPSDEAEVKVCTLEDMELLIPTVLKPEDYEHPVELDQVENTDQQLVVAMDTESNSAETLTAVELPQYIQQTNTSNTNSYQPYDNLSIGTEYLVLPDGSLQQLKTNDVIIEYINADGCSNKNNNYISASNPSLTNLASNVSAQSASEPCNGQLPMDVEQLVVDDQAILRTTDQEKVGSTFILPTKHKCGMCPKTFATQSRLKSHQLTHSNLPKFFCDQCEYYSLRSADLMEHYKAGHRMEFNAKNSAHLTGNEDKIFTCDLCLFETQSRGQLRLHYNSKHMIEPTEVQLRPSWCAKDETGSSFAKGNTKENNLRQMPDFPLGIKYPPSACTAVTTIPAQQLTSANSDVVASLIPYSPNVHKLGATVNVPPPLPETIDNANTTNALGMFPEMSASLASKDQTQTLSNATQGSIFGDMQDFIDNSDVAAVCTIPAECMPVPDGEDIVIDNNLSLDFDTENLFDFEDEEEEEEEEENDDENDNNDAATDQNLLLTTDDEDLDDFDDEQSKNLQKPYCIYCNKKFTSQYKFENHMFVHRGLAPYRCELCTNLYNKKRALIRHYKAVHKRMPTRDMVQAKGDKVSWDRAIIEQLNFEPNKPPAIMCAKCPFECELESDMSRHLNAHHGINDGVSCHAGEVFIIRKLPFECPRCIRTFAAKRTLARHLQRSHLVDTTIELQSGQVAGPAKTTTVTSTVTAILTNVDPTENQTLSTTTTAAAMTVESVNNQDDQLKADNEGDLELHNNPAMSTSALPTSNEVMTSVSGVDNKDDLQMHNNSLMSTSSTPTTNKVMTTATGVMTSRDALTTCLDISTERTSRNSIAEMRTVTPSTSTLFVTATSMDAFDFEYDFMGDVHTTNPSVIKNQVEDGNIEKGCGVAAASTSSGISSISTSSQLVSDDRLLTEALEPSPLKQPINIQLRTPIYVCKQCNYTCDELAKYKEHQIQQHSNDDPTLPKQHSDYKCSICNYTYRTITLLKFHMKRHIKRSFKCNQCPKTFAQKPELDKHLIAHTNEFPFKCDVDGCKKAFNYKHHLKRHQNASHLYKRYTCPLPDCGRQMTSNAQLLVHVKSHKGLHSYKCPKCPNAFPRRTTLRAHAMRKHKLTLSDDELAGVYLATMGHSNRHDLQVLTRNGELIRRAAAEQATIEEQRSELAEAVVNIIV